MLLYEGESWEIWRIITAFMYSKTEKLTLLKVCRNGPFFTDDEVGAGGKPGRVEKPLIYSQNQFCQNMYHI